MANTELGLALVASNAPVWLAAPLYAVNKALAAAIVRRVRVVRVPADASLVTVSKTLDSSSRWQFKLCVAAVAVGAVDGLKDEHFDDDDGGGAGCSSSGYIIVCPQISLAHSPRPRRGQAITADELRGVFRRLPGHAEALRIYHMQVFTGAFTTAAQWPKLQDLYTSFNEIGTAGARSLAAAAPNLPSLRRLQLSCNCLCSDSVEALTNAVWPRLEELRLDNNGIGPAGARSLAAASGRLPRLRCLSVGWNHLGNSGVAALAAIAWPQLRELSLSGNIFGAASLAAGATNLAGLERLSITASRLGDDGVTALAAAAWPRLLQLLLHNNHIGTAGAHSLAAAAPNLPSLKWLSIDDCDDDGAKAALTAAMPNCSIEWVRRPDCFHTPTTAGAKLQHQQRPEARFSCPEARGK